MMKFIFMIIFMIPLIFNFNFWLFCNFISYFFIFYVINMKMSYFIIINGFSFGLDVLSNVMNLLSIWICLLMIIASFKIYNLNNYGSYFIFIVVFMMMVFIITFSTMNLFIFYMFFEISLIPVLILIFGWGYQYERIQAGVYLLFYTLLASLPLLVMIMYLNFINGSLFMFYLNKICLNNVFFFFLMNMVFFVKMPMYMLHLWLPKAHVEAPISGSMILAGVMLKLGGYGIIRLISMFKFILPNFNGLLISISLFGGFFVSLICIRQVDVKSLIAYSSISHMSLVIGGLISLNYLGMSGSLFMMLAHGLCSSGMFCVVNIFYERSFSRSIFLNKGMGNLMSNFMLLWFLLCSNNMAAPPSLNLLSEILLINSLIKFSSYFIFFIMMMSFFSAVYSLYLFSFTFHGVSLINFYCYNNISIREFFLIFMHWFPLNISVLFSNMMLI